MVFLACSFGVANSARAADVSESIFDTVEMQNHTEGQTIIPVVIFTDEANHTKSVRRLEVDASENSGTVEVPATEGSSTKKLRIYFPEVFAHFSFVQIFSVTLGFVVAVGEEEEGRYSGGRPSGVLVELQPGVNGGLVALGYSYKVCDYCARGSLFDAPIRVDLKGVLYQNWRTAAANLFAVSNPVNAGQTYAGIMAGYQLAFLKVNIGLLKKVSGSQDAHPFLFDFGFGLGW